MRIPDRGSAGRLLAHAVSRHDFDDPVVIGLGAGGLAVGAEVARVLGCPLDILDIEELGAGDPLHPSRAFGALSGGDHLLIRPESLDRIRGGQALREAVRRARRSIGNGGRERVRGGTVPTSWRTVILVDDGTSSRDTVVAAVDLVRAGRPGRVVVAIPTAPQENLEELERLVGEVIAGSVMPWIEWFHRHGHLYEDDSVPTGEQVEVLLKP